MRKWLASAAALAALLCGARAHAQRLLSDAEVETALVGKSALFADYSVATYGPGGLYTFVAANNLYFQGKYTISGGKLCIAIRGLPDRCDAVGADGYGLYLLSAANMPLRITVTNPVIPQNVANFCGVQVAYTVYPPSPDVPENISAFSGTWVGKWDYGMCTALIVESVQPDGVARVIYINGDYGLEHPPFKAGSSRFTAVIRGGKLSDGGKTTSFEAVVRNRGNLTATRTGRPGVGTASYSRN